MALLAAILFAGISIATPGHRVRSTAALSNAKTSLTLIYQNNLNASDDWRHIGAILLDPMGQRDGAAACSSIGESLISKSALEAHSSDFVHSLSYLEYSGSARTGQKYYIQNGTFSIDQRAITLGFPAPEYGQNQVQLPVLCTQSSANNAVAIPSNQISILSSGNTYIGYRNQRSFRFSGIPYADPVQRFEYSTSYSARGKTIQATSFGSDCAQAYDPGSGENCLFLNIQTPYIPRSGSKTKTKLKPVLFTIHGGGYTGGSGGGLDAGNLASRHDIVGVSINYRLTTLGFLAVPGTNIKGNYGIGDQVTALRWVKQNIANFGGDPNRITIIGESAGAGSVRALLGSPPVIKENLIAGGVAQSNLGGQPTLGLSYNYGTTYSSYYTIPESYAVAGQQIFQEAGCNQTSLADQVACLKVVPADTLVTLPTVARYVVQDGYFVNTEQLIVSQRNDSTAHVPVIFGTTADDGASIGSSYPKTPATTEVEGIQASLSISEKYAQAIIDSGLFPYYDTGNVTLDSFNVSQRVATDTTFRCIDEATVYAGAKTGAFKSAYYYTIDRTYQGYDPSNLGPSLTAGPISPAFPNGDPEKPYFRLHGADLGFTYGNQYPLRDENDLLASQLISGYFAQFAKTGDPNTPEEYLKVRGYTEELKQARQSGRWEEVKGESGPAKALDVVSATTEFPDLKQCTWLGFGIEYYLEGGR